jgi:hypothetical protein
MQFANYDISDAVSFAISNCEDATLKQSYPKSYSKFSPVQLYINGAKAGGHPLRWIEHALNNSPGLPSFSTPFPDDPSLIYTHSYAYNHNRIRTAIQLALRGARLIRQHH